MDKAGAELNEVMERFRANQRARIPALIASLPVAIVLNFWLNIPIPIFVVLAFWLLSSFILGYLVERQKVAARVDKIHFGYFFLEVLMLTAIAYYVGTVT